VTLHVAPVSCESLRLFTQKSAGSSIGENAHNTSGVFHDVSLFLAQAEMVRIFEVHGEILRFEKGHDILNELSPNGQVR